MNEINGHKMLLLPMTFQINTEAVFYDLYLGKSVSRLTNWTNMTLTVLTGPLDYNSDKRSISYTILELKKKKKQIS